MLKIATVIGLIVLVYSIYNRIEVQTYHVGSVGFPGVSQKVEGQIIIDDSTVTIGFNGIQKVFEIEKKIETTLILTDGIRTSRLTVTPKTGKEKGFAYDHQLFYEGETSTIYFCRKI